MVSACFWSGRRITLACIKLWGIEVARGIDGEGNKRGLLIKEKD